MTKTKVAPFYLGHGVHTLISQHQCTISSCSKRLSMAQNIQNAATSVLLLLLVGEM